LEPTGLRQTDIEGCTGCAKSDILFNYVNIMNTLIRRKTEQWLGLDRQEDRHVQYVQQ